jgi:hypothetical protein
LPVSEVEDVLVVDIVPSVPPEDAVLSGGKPIGAPPSCEASGGVAEPDCPLQPTAKSENPSTPISAKARRKYMKPPR